LYILVEATKFKSWIISSIQAGLKLPANLVLLGAIVTWAKLSYNLTYTSLNAPGDFRGLILSLFIQARISSSRSESGLHPTLVRKLASWSTLEEEGLQGTWFNGLDGTRGLVWTGLVGVTGLVVWGAGTCLVETGLDGRFGFGSPCCGKLYLKHLQ